MVVQLVVINQLKIGPPDRSERPMEKGENERVILFFQDLYPGFMVDELFLHTVDLLAVVAHPGLQLVKDLLELIDGKRQGGDVAIQIYEGLDYHGDGCNKAECPD